MSQCKLPNSRWFIMAGGVGLSAWVNGYEFFDLVPSPEGDTYELRFNNAATGEVTYICDTFTILEGQEAARLFLPMIKGRQS